MCRTTLCCYGSPLPPVSDPFPEATRGPLIAPLCKFYFSIFGEQVLSDGWVPGQAEGVDAPAHRAEIFFFRGTGLPTVMRKNQPLVPRSNFGGKACARTSPWFRGQTLLVPGDGENWLAPVGGHGCRLKEGGGVWEMDTCDRTYVWSSLSAFFFLLCYPLSDF